MSATDASDRAADDLVAGQAGVSTEVLLEQARKALISI